MILTSRLCMSSSGAEPVPSAENHHEWHQPHNSALVVALLNKNLHLAKLLADALFYTQKELNYLNKLCPPTNGNTIKSTNINERSPKGGFADRLKKSRSKPDLFDYNANFGKSFDLDANANTTKNLFRRTQSSDTLFNSFLNSTLKQFQDKEISHILSNDAHTNINEKVNALKKLTNRKLDLDIKETIHESEDEDKMNIDHKTRRFIEELRSTVPSLQRLSRRSVHRAVSCSGDRTAIVNQLPVKPSLHKYILFEEQDQKPLLRLNTRDTLYM